MRWLTLLLLCALASTGFGQDPQGPADGLFGAVKPDVSIVIRKHDTGADLVEITMLNPNYPPDLLKQQIAAIGKQLGVEPRGVQAAKAGLPGDDNPNLQFVKGSFAIDGLIDEENHRLAIQPILRAFTGVPEPLRIKGFLIHFGRLAPHKNYVQNFRNEHVAAQARVASTGIQGIEYRILVDAEKPEDVAFPDFVPERKMEPQPSQTEGGGVSPAMWVAIGAASLATGALVYLALLRTGRPRARPPQKRG